MEGFRFLFEIFPVLVAMHAAVHVLDHVLQWGPVATSGSPSPRDVPVQPGPFRVGGALHGMVPLFKGRQFTIL